MMMTPFFRKLNLSAHIISSVGWLGSVAAFVAIAITGLVSNDDQVIRSCYIVMEMVTLFVIVPASFAAFSTGVIQGIGTPWGLFRHYWIIVKLVFTVIATVVLLLHLQPISILGNQAATSSALLHDSKSLRIQVLADGAAAVLLLMAITAISIYKPWGRVTSGLNKESAITDRKWIWKLIFIGIGLSILAFIIVHLLKGKMAHQ
jgi:hypothetical protein